MKCIDLADKITLEKENLAEGKGPLPSRHLVDCSEPDGDDSIAFLNELANFQQRELTKFAVLDVTGKRRPADRGLASMQPPNDIVREALQHLRAIPGAKSAEMFFNHCFL